MELYRGKRLSIEKKVFRLPDGRERERIIVHPGNAVAILPFTDDGGCYLIRQYRFAIASFIYEVPAGTMEEGEDPEETARRELIEETGFSAGRMINRGCIYTTPGFTDERLHLFEAHDLSPSSVFTKDEDEMIELVRVDAGDLGKMCRDGRICDAKTICLIFKCLDG